MVSEDNPTVSWESLTDDDFAPLSSGQLGILKVLHRFGGPISREEYIKANWQPVPSEEDWTPEMESELPEFLRRADR
jgi:hypothetical protein